MRSYEEIHAEHTGILAAYEGIRRLRHDRLNMAANYADVTDGTVLDIENGDLGRVDVESLRRYLNSVGCLLHVEVTLPNGRRLPLVESDNQFSES